MLERNRISKYLVFELNEMIAGRRTVLLAQTAVPAWLQRAALGGSASIKNKAFLLWVFRCSDPSMSSSPRCRSESSEFCSSQFLMKRAELKKEVVLEVPETFESQNPPSLWPGQYNIKLAVGQNVSLRFTYTLYTDYMRNKCMEYRYM